MKEKEYRIKSTGRGMDYYGHCERCGKVCNTHYKQQFRLVGQDSNVWQDAGFGHVECLRNGPWESVEVVEV